VQVALVIAHSAIIGYLYIEARLDQLWANSCQDLELLLTERLEALEQSLWDVLDDNVRSLQRRYRIGDKRPPPFWVRNYLGKSSYCRHSFWRRLRIECCHGLPFLWADGPIISLLTSVAVKFVQTADLDTIASECAGACG
jgi:hypothetical protein